MSRIAVISDLHANLPAMKAFLSHIEDLGGVELVLNLGDFVNLGPYPRETAGIVLGDPRFVNVLGNHELAVLEAQEARGENILAHAWWTRQRLGADLLERIRVLPRTRAMEIGVARFFLAHTDLDHNWRAHQAPQAWSRGDQNLPAYDWFLHGHTHEPVYRPDSSPRLLNPGSLGCSRDETASFCLFDLNAKESGVSLLKIPYDKPALLEAYQRLDVPYRREIVQGYQ